MNKLQEEIEKQYAEYIKEHNEEPRYASVAVRFLDEENSFDTIIKLLDDYDENNTPDWEDEQTFFYCNGLNDLKSLCEKGCEDFVITDLYELFNSLD
jgi:hypothetical protein